MRTPLILFPVIFAPIYLNGQIMANKGMPDTFVLVVHGGAGTILKKNITPEKEKAYKDKLAESLGAGYEILKKGGTSLDAVEASIRILEDSPLFNAGKGSVFTSDGKNEMDAAVMDGKTLKAGAVASVRTIRNPITAARAVMEKSPHVMMVGRGAELFAKENGIEIVDTSYFYDEIRFNQLRNVKEQEKMILDHTPDTTGDIQRNFDAEFKGEKWGTVGAVALDKHGNLAAGTSTGGMTNKKFGRVGDSPIIGAGTYANNQTCAISCTGHGEFFMRTLAAHDVSARMEYKGISLKNAADEVVNVKLKAMGGEGGLIAVDRNGNITMPFNSEGMYRGYINAEGKPQVLIYKE